MTDMRVPPRSVTNVTMTIETIGMYTILGFYDEDTA
jgi:hypothetical protein